MLRFIHPNKSPPGGNFHWFDPVTGVKVSKPSRMRLFMAVKGFLQANRRGGEFSQAQIEDMACQHTPSPCYDYDAPNAVQQTIQAMTSVATWVAQGAPKTSKEVLQTRLEACNACSHWGGQLGDDLISSRCGKCGCSGLKLAMATSKCPIGKW